MFVQLYSSFYVGFLKGKGASLGVGRGRAAVMRARVRFFLASLLNNNRDDDYDDFFFFCL